MMPCKYVQRTRGQYPAAPPKAPFQTIWQAGPLTGPNQDRRVLNDGIFARPD